MFLSDFLREFSEKDFFENRKVFAFQRKEYPLLFFHHLLKKIEHTHASRAQRLYLHEAEAAAVKSQLTMSFLGETQVYWLGNLNELPAKQKESWSSYLLRYDGPHKLIFFIEGEKESDDALINIPQHIDKKTYQLLQTLIKPGIRDAKKNFSTKLFGEVDKLELDAACLVLEYHSLVGSNVDSFLGNWLTRLVPAEKSLFLLSQYFFSKNGKNFMNLWQEIRSSYSNIFWITFWGEQVWRAYYVVKFYRAKKIVEAKKISFRLPFSFLQKDWRNVQITELRNAHDYIYRLDHRIKNGGSDTELELFYAKFISGEFKN